MAVLIRLRLAGFEVTGDNITLEAVHEPSTIAVLGIGVAALGPLLRRR